MSNPLKKALGHVQKMAEEGVWDDVPGMEDYGMKVLVAKMGNTKYLKYVKELNKPYMKNLRARQSIPDAVIEENVNKALAKTILLDWENMPSDDFDKIYEDCLVDNPELLKKDVNDPNAWIAYSQKAAYNIFKDPELEEFREVISSISTERANYQIEKDDFEES